MTGPVFAKLLEFNMPAEAAMAVGFGLASSARIPHYIDRAVMWKQMNATAGKIIGRLKLAKAVAEKTTLLFLCAHNVHIECTWGDFIDSGADEA